MQLTRHTDYALRLLIQLASHPGQRLSIAEVAREQAISRSHLMKVANGLAHAGFIKAVRGRGGGIELGRDPAQISIAEIVAAMEPGCALVDCSGCKLRPRCGLPAMLGEALSAFLQTLRGYSLADVMRA